MIQFSDYATSYFQQKEIFSLIKLPYQISIIVACPSGTSIEAVEEFARKIEFDPKQVELIFVIDSPYLYANEIKSIKNTEKYRILYLAKPCGLLAVMYDVGILHSKGNWIWMLDIREDIKHSYITTVLQTTLSSYTNQIPVFINTADNLMLNTAATDHPHWLDLFYKGMQIHLANILFPRQIFSTYGLIDPHIAIFENSPQDFILRICRYIDFQRVISNDAPNLAFNYHYAALFFYWVDIDRRIALHPDLIAAYLLDDLDQYRNQLPEELIQKVYIEIISPYFTRYRHAWENLSPLSLQSYPSEKRNVMLLKTDYETATDVVFRNFDLFSKGQGAFKLSYVQSAGLPGIQYFYDDALILFRTATHDCLEFARRISGEGKPVGYALDDDLLHFYELGESFADFRPGHPAYDAMVESMKLADVVICGNAHIEETIPVHNRRTIKSDGSMLPEFLNDTNRETSGPIFKFGYAGGGYRIKEMRFIWPAIEKICSEYGDKVKFEFWGIDSKVLPGQLPQIECKPFTTNYYDYLQQLSTAGFDAMLIPHFLDPAPRRGKNPNKVYETVVAGAIGIYSNVPTYSIVNKFNIGILVEEDPEAWYEALRKAIEMPKEIHDEFRERAMSFVREHYSTPALLPKHEASLQALLFHGATRNFRAENGKPIAMFVFPVIGGTGGGEITLRRRMEAAMQAGIEPLVVIPEWVTNTADINNFEKYLARQNLSYETVLFRAFVITPQPGDDLLPLKSEEDSFRQLFLKHSVALVHSAGYIPALGKICSEMGITHISSNYGIDDRFEWPMGTLPFKYCDIVHSDSVRYATKWGNLFKSDWAVLRDIAPEGLFVDGFKRLHSNSEVIDRPIRIGMVGTIMRRKCNKEAIQAVIQLIEEGYPIQFTLHGSLKADLDYVNECRSLIENHHCADKILFSTGYVESLSDVYQQLDMVMTVSTHESFPNVIKEGTASGVLLICSHAGGIDELMVDGVNGIMVKDSSVPGIVQGLKRALNLGNEQNLWIRRNAYHLACQEFHPRKGLNDLLAIYNQVLYSAGYSSARNQIAVSRTRPRGMFVESGSQSPGKWIIDHAPYIPLSTRRVGQKIRYEFTAKHNLWTQLNIYLGTHQRQAHGKLLLRILSRYGELLREQFVVLDDVRDNSWVSFNFEPIRNSENQTFLLEICLKKRDSGTEISIYEGSPRVPKLQKLLRRIIAQFGLISNGDKLVYRASFEKE